jgi:hypothetical protein
MARRRARRPGGAAEHPDAVHAGHRLGLRTPARARERIRTAQRGLERERTLGRLRGPEPGSERSRVVARGRPVVGELGQVARGVAGVTRRPRLERLGVGPMEQPALAGEELVVHDLLNQRVPERVALLAGGRRLDDQSWPAMASRRASITSASGMSETTAMRSWSADRPATAITPSTRWAGSRRRDARDQDLLSELDRRRPSPPPLAARSPRRRTVAVRRRWIDPTRPGVGSAPRRREELAVPSSSRRRGRSLDAARALELREPREQRVPPVELVRAECHDHQHPLGPRLRTRNVRVSRVAGSAQ